MADVIPFKGLRYNPDIVGNLSGVMTPPFDVINAQAQCQFYDMHPCNIIRLILGKTLDDDCADCNRYTRAAQTLQKWKTEKVLVKDQAPALYLSAVDFTVDDRPLTRYGLIARVRLEPFDKGVILPHERTFSQVKSERFQLLQACHTNFSPIFSLYPDQLNILDTLKSDVAGRNPDAELTDMDGMHHRLWCLTDPERHSFITAAMAGTPIYIADGHHRYETALNYRDRLIADGHKLASDHPARFVMMYLCSMTDPGLVILPAHRMFRQNAGIPTEDIISKARSHFDVVKIHLTDDNRDAARMEMARVLETNASAGAIGVSMNDFSALYVLILKAGTMQQLFADELSSALRDLDVTVLTRLLLIDILGFDPQRLDDVTLVDYASDVAKAIDAVADGKFAIAFILNPTPIDQVRQIADEGEVMPRKSTYFYPKVLTGQVLSSLSG